MKNFQFLLYFLAVTVMSGSVCAHGVSRNFLGIDLSREAEEVELPNDVEQTANEVIDDRVDGNVSEEEEIRKIDISESSSSEHQGASDKEPAWEFKLVFERPSSSNEELRERLRCIRFVIENGRHSSGLFNGPYMSTFKNSEGDCTEENSDENSEENIEDGEDGPYLEEPHEEFE